MFTRSRQQPALSLMRMLANFSVYLITMHSCDD